MKRVMNDILFFRNWQSPDRKSGKREHNAKDVLIQCSDLGDIKEIVPWKKMHGQKLRDELLKRRESQKRHKLWYKLILDNVVKI